MRAAIRTNRQRRARPAKAWRARILAGALLAATSCATSRAPLREAADSDIRPPLSRAEADRAEALALYSRFLILQDREPESPRLTELLRRAAEKDPDELAFRLWLGNAYLSQGQAAEAIPGLKDAVRRFPESDALFFQLGLAYEEADRIPEARRVYRKLKARAPRQGEAYVRLAGLAFRDEQPAQAFAFLDEALDKVQEPLPILALYDLLGEQFLADRKPWLASVCFSRITARQPGNLGAHERLMRSRLAAGDRPGATRELEALAAADPAQSSWAHLLGELAEEADDPARAAGWYEKAIAGNASRPDSWLRLGLIRRRESLDAAVQTLREGFERFPQDIRFPVTIGALFHNDARMKEAIAHFEQAEALLKKAVESGRTALPVSPYFYFWYATACDSDGQTERAEALFETSIRLFPKLSESYNYLAFLWAERNVNLDRALAYSLKSLEMKPDDPAYLDTLGWIHFRRGNLPEAEALVRKAVEREEHAEMTGHMGDILEAQGRLDEALNWWRKSAARNPEGPAAKKLKAHGAAGEANP